MPINSDENPIDVLLVEDGEKSALLMAEYLRSHGHTVITTADGISAMKLIKRRAFPFKVLATGIDLHCPVTGWDLARAARTSFDGAGVVYLCAGSQHDWPKHRVADSRILRKPFTMQALADEIARLSSTSTASTMDRL